MNGALQQKNEAQAADASLTVRAVWFMAARTLAFALSFGLPLLLVRRLDQHQFGLYKQVFLLVLTAINVLPLGIEMSAFYFLPRAAGGQDRARVVLNILIFYTMMTGGAGLTLALCPSVISGLFNNTDLARYAPLMAVMIPLWGAPFVLETIATANEDTRLASAFIVTSEVCKTLLLCGAALLAPSVRSLIVAGIVHGAIQAGILVAYGLRRFGWFVRSFDWAVLRNQLSYALPFGAAAILFRLQVDLHNYYVSRHFGPAEYAIYSIGCFNLPFISILGYSISGVLMPRVNRLQTLGRSREIIELCARTMRKTAAIYLPIYVYLLVVGREFISFLFTDRYLASWPIFEINLTMIPLATITIINDAVMRAHSEQRHFLLRLRLLLIPVLLVGLWYGTGRVGLLGAILAVVGISLIETAATGLRVLQLLGARLRDFSLFKDIGRLALASVAAGISAELTRLMLRDRGALTVLVSCAAVFSIVYPAAVLMMNVATQDEVARVRQMSTGGLRALLRRRRPEPLIEES